MMEDVSRTVLALANLAMSSLLATSLAIGVVHVAGGSKGSALCRACLDYRTASKPDTEPPPRVPVRHVALATVR